MVPVFLSLGKMVISAGISLALIEAFRRAEEKRRAAKQSTPVGSADGFEKGSNMEEIFGLLEAFSGEDDAFGAVGLSEIFGADTDVIDALVSGSEIVGGGGDGYEEIIGAVAAKSGVAKAQALVKAAKAAKIKQAVNAIAQRGAAGVVNRPLDRKRRYPLGFVPTSVASATAAQIPSAPQNLFRPERLVIPSDVSFDFGVRDIKVGNQSQLVQSVEIPGAIFSEVAIDTYVGFDTAMVGNQVSVDVRNKSGGTLEFTAALIGTVAK